MSPDIRFNSPAGALQIMADWVRTAVRVKFLYYEGTMQESCLRLMATSCWSLSPWRASSQERACRAWIKDGDMLSAMARELVEKNGRMTAKVSTERIGPAWRRWSWLGLLPDCSEKISSSILLTASWSKQPKIPNCALITLENVLGQEVIELFQGTANLNHLA